MKHVKLFENFGTNPIITATGDFSKIVKSGSTFSDQPEAISYIVPNTYIVTYYSNPSKELIDLESSTPGPSGTGLPPDQAVEQIVGGDQNDLYLGQYANGMVIFEADPSFSPEDYKIELEDWINNFNEYPELEQDNCELIFGNPGMAKDFTPEYLNHCKAVVSGSGMNMNPRIKLIFRVV